MNAIDAALICRGLSDFNRMQIVQQLTGGEQCACKLLAHFDITQPTLSHHMKVLCDCGLARVRKEGKWSHYSLNGETLAAFRRFIDVLGGEVRQ